MKRSLCCQCLRPLTVCFCHTIHVVDNHWPIIILQHAGETNRAIGTAKIAQLSLKNCQTYIYQTHIKLNHTKQTKNDKLSDTQTREHNKRLVESICEQAPLLVYPGDNSITVEQLATDVNKKPQTQDKAPLLFIDGTWRKSRRMLYECPALAALPRVSLLSGQASRYLIRKVPNDSALSTVEAIAASLSALEGSKDKYQSLLNSMDWMIEQQIKAMGEEKYQRNYLKNN
jgi:DTW domain-containing protein YfiP